MGGARVTTLVTLRKCTLGNKREIKTLKFVSASTKGFKGGLAWIKPSKKNMAVTFSYYSSCPHRTRTFKCNCHSHHAVYGRLSRHATLARPDASGLRGYDHGWLRSWVGLARPRGSPWSLLPSYHVPCPDNLPLAGRSRGWEWRNSVGFGSSGAFFGTRCAFAFSGISLIFGGETSEVPLPWGLL